MDVLLRHQRSRSEGGVADLVQCTANADADESFEVEILSSGGESNAPLSNPELTFPTHAVTAVTTPASEFLQQLLKVLYVGMTPPEPVLIKALINDPPFGFFSRLPTAAAAADHVGYGLASDYPPNHRVPRRISTVRSGLGRLFSPMRKISHAHRSRPSTASLPAQMMLVTGDRTARGEHWWSMVQLAAETPAQSSQLASAAPPPVQSNMDSFKVSATEDSKTVNPVMPTKETGPDSVSTSALKPSAAVKDDAQIGRLRRDIQRLETAILSIESRKSNLSDWFLEQMLVAQGAGDDEALGSGNGGGFSEDEIKRNYKKRNAELKQRLLELKSRLSDKQLILSRLEGQKADESDEPTGKTFTTTAITATTPSRPSNSSKRDSTGAAPDDDTDISLPRVTTTPSMPKGEQQSMTEFYNKQSKYDKRPEDLPPAPPSSKPVSVLPRTSSTKATASSPPPPPPSSSVKPTKLHTLPVSQPPSLASESTIVAKTSLSNAGHSSFVSHQGASAEDRPVTESLGHFAPVHFLLDGAGTLQHAPPSSMPSSQTAKQQSTARKSRNSARRVLKQGLGLFTKPFGRRSEGHRMSSPLGLKKSVSEEHLSSTAMFPSLNHSPYRLNKVSSALNAWSTGSAVDAPTTSKRGKSQKQGNGCGTDPLSHLEVNSGSVKKSQTGSVSSRPSHQRHRYQQSYHLQMGESGATSGAGSEKSGPPGSSSSPPLNPYPPRSSSAQQAIGPAGTTSSMPLSNVFDVVDVLYGGSVGSSAPLGGLPRGNPLVTSSGGASTHSGGGGGGAGGRTVTNGMSVMGTAPSVGGGLPLSPSTTSPPPAYNVAMALVMLHQRIQSLLDAHTEAQQKLTSEIREELNSLRVDLRETRDIVNSITVEVEALRRDMQTKEEVHNQKLVDAVARLEQLDASAEKLRQNVQQDLIAIRNEQKHALEPLKYQLATETRDLRDMFTTLNNKVTILEKCERLSNLDRDQPQMLRSIANTLVDFAISLVAFVTTLIMMLIRFLNIGANATNSRISSIVLNVCLIILFLAIFLNEPLVRWWNRTYSPVQQPPR